MSLNQLPIDIFLIITDDLIISDLKHLCQTNVDNYRFISNCDRLWEKVSKLHFSDNEFKKSWYKTFINHNRKDYRAEKKQQKKQERIKHKLKWNKPILFISLFILAAFLFFTSIFGFVFFACGKDGNQTCYGKAEFKTLIIKDLHRCWPDDDYCTVAQYTFQGDDQSLWEAFDDEAECIYRYERTFGDLQVGDKYPVYVNEYTSFDTLYTTKAIMVDFQTSSNINGGYSCMNPPVKADYYIYIVMMSLTSLALPVCLGLVVYFVAKAHQS